MCFTSHYTFYGVSAPKKHKQRNTKQRITLSPSRNLGLSVGLLFGLIVRGRHQEAELINLLAFHLALAVVVALFDWIRDKWFKYL